LKGENFFLSSPPPLEKGRISSFFSSPSRGKERIFFFSSPSFGGGGLRWGRC